MITTERLRLRQWREEDFLYFGELCADEEVMAFFPKCLNQAESRALGKKIQSLIEENGWGFWAVEVLKPEVNACPFIGFVGLHNVAPELAFSPSIEIGWRLARSAWGKGYASEAAKAALQFGFETLDAERIVSFAVINNSRSINVMKNIGMTNCHANFHHPAVPKSSPLSEHVLYSINRRRTN